jgi:hypothetical protein
MLRNELAELAARNPIPRICREARDKVRRVLALATPLCVLDYCSHPQGTAKWDAIMQALQEQGNERDFLGRLPHEPWIGRGGVLVADARHVAIYMSLFTSDTFRRFGSAQELLKTVKKCFGSGVETLYLYDKRLARYMEECIDQEPSGLPCLSEDICDVEGQLVFLPRSGDPED